MENFEILKTLICWYKRSVDDACNEKKKKNENFSQFEIWSQCIFVEFFGLVREINEYFKSGEGLDKIKKYIINEFAAHLKYILDNTTKCNSFGYNSIEWNIYEFTLKVFELFNENDIKDSLFFILKELEQNEVYHETSISKRKLQEIKMFQTNEEEQSNEIMLDNDDEFDITNLPNEFFDMKLPEKYDLDLDEIFV